MAIDGMLIFDLTDEDLKNDMKIDLSLHRKKILKAIEVLVEYGEALKKGKTGDAPNPKFINESYPIPGNNYNKNNENFQGHQVFQENNSNSNLNFINDIKADNIVKNIEDKPANQDTMYYLVEREPENVF